MRSRRSSRPSDASSSRTLAAAVVVRDSVVVDSSMTVSTVTMFAVSMSTLMCAPKVVQPELRA